MILVHKHTVDKEIDFKIPDSPIPKNPQFIPNEDYIHYLSGSIASGAIGFETFGLGSAGNNSRNLYERGKNHLFLYSKEGYKYINTPVMIWEILDFTHPLAILANSLYQIYQNQLDFRPHTSKTIKALFKSLEGKIDMEINIDLIFKLFDELDKVTSYYKQCELILKFITGNNPSSNYTYNIENDLTQNYHLSMVDIDESEENSLVGVYFHTGCDVRCGFSSPVFGVVIDSGYNYENNVNIYFPVCEGDYIPVNEIVDSKNCQEITEFLREHGFSPDVPLYCDSDWEIIDFYKNHGLFEVKVSNPLTDKENYFGERELIPTEKLLNFLKWKTGIIPGIPSFFEKE